MLHLTATDIQVGDILTNSDSEFYELVTKIETIQDSLTKEPFVRIYSKSLDYDFNPAYSDLDLFSSCHPDHIFVDWSIVPRPDFDLGI